MDRLHEARRYWVSSTRPDGSPHSRPVWAVWLDGALLFSCGSQIVRNLDHAPAVSVHVTSRQQVLILEGHASRVTDLSILRRFVEIYGPKYEWELDAQALREGRPGPVFAIEPQVAYGWKSDRLGGATRWTFPRRR